MSTIKEMKQQLKAMALAIRTNRQEFRQNQREHSLWKNVHPEYFAAAWNSPIAQEYRKLPYKWFSPADVRNYRYLHIVYCLARGRTYEQIEPKVREGNEVDMKIIEKMLAEVVREPEAIRPSA